MKALFVNRCQRQISLTAALLLTLALLARAGEQAGVHAIAKAVDEHYNRLQTLQADFTETYRGAGMDRVESGTLWLKKPGKMRWQYRSPREKLFLSDGKDAWFYVPGDQQARKMPMKKLDDWRSPLGLLLGKTKLEKELEGLSWAQDVLPMGPGNWVLRGLPKAWEGRVAQVILEVTREYRIARIQIEETDGSVTEFRFDHQQENVAVGGIPFTFVPPPGVEVVTGDFGQ